MVGKPLIWNIKINHFLKIGKEEKTKPAATQ